MSKRFAALLLILAVSPARAGKVEMCVDEACTNKVWREKLDCQVHKNKKKSLTFGFKLSVAFVASVGPEATFGRNAEINWNRMSQELIRRYEELCDFHNKGLYSVAEFNRRYDKLQEYYDKAKDIKAEVEDSVGTRAKKAFDDLDKEAKKHSGEGDLASALTKVSTINKEISDLGKDVKEFGSEDKKPSDAKPAP